MDTNVSIKLENQLNRIENTLDAMCFFNLAIVVIVLVYIGSNL